MTDLRAYFDFEIEKSSLPSLAIDKNIFSIVEHELWQCLQSLDEMPRTETFWRTSNNKATFFKLSEYSEKVLMKINPAKAAWCKFSVAVLYGGNEVLSETIWDVLRNDQRFSIEWIIDIGWWFDAYTGIGTIKWVVNILRRFQLLGEGKELLSVLYQNQTAQKKAWLTDVNKLIKSFI